jgi:hypothetical protein
MKGHKNNIKIIQNLSILTFAFTAIVDLNFPVLPA